LQFGAYCLGHLIFSSSFIWLTVIGFLTHSITSAALVCVTDNNYNMLCCILNLWLYTGLFKKMRQNHDALLQLPRIAMEWVSDHLKDLMLEMMGNEIFISRFVFSDKGLSSFYSTAVLIITMCVFGKKSLKHFSIPLTMRFFWSVSHDNCIVPFLLRKHRYSTNLSLYATKLRGYIHTYRIYI